MLQIHVVADGGRGKSTLAALIAQALTTHGIPFQVVDGEPEAGDAAHLLLDGPRLARNTASVAGREAACGGQVVIKTIQVSPTPTARPRPSPVVDG